MKRIPCVLSIAGSDSGGGAGIQADLKTFSALCVHGVSVITSITAQNTCNVLSIFDVPVEIVKAQIKALLEDIPINSAKTGMLHTNDLIEVVANELKKQDFPLVVDPVMVAKSGSILMEEEAIQTLIKRLLPIATIVTPNIPEAEKISGIEINNSEDVKKAAKNISDLGAEAIVINGGHLPGELIIDVLYYLGKYYTFKANRINQDTTHGTGCVFSSSIAAELAKGSKIHEAIGNAKKFMNDSIRFGYKVGEGVGLVNPMATIHREAEKFSVIESLNMAIQRLEQNQEIAKLVPEVQMNLVMAIYNAKFLNDVAGIAGRIVRIGNKVKASSHPEFGVSSHLANTVLTAMRYDPSKRAGMNVKYLDEIIQISNSLGFTNSSYDREKEPNEVENTEGKTTSWGADQAIKKIGKVPDIIWHLGGWGKEPMISILGKNPMEVVNKALRIANIFNSARAY